MSTTVYTWNPLTDSVIEESDGSGNSLCTYTNEPSTFGPLVSETRGGMTSYYHADALGSTRLTTNSSQAVADSFLFDAWGDAVTTTAPSVTPYQWCGRWGYHMVTAITSIYVRERTYASSTSRWTSAAPLTRLLQINPRRPSRAYIYCYNAPQQMLDQSGLAPGLNGQEPNNIPPLLSATPDLLFTPTLESPREPDEYGTLNIPFGLFNLDFQLPAHPAAFFNNIAIHNLPSIQIQLFFWGPPPEVPPDSPMEPFFPGPGTTFPIEPYFYDALPWQRLPERPPGPIQPGEPIPLIDPTELLPEFPPTYPLFIDPNNVFG